MKRKILVAALLALLLTLVATSALAACGITIGSTGPNTFIKCDVEGTHPYTYEYYSATQCQRYAIHSNSETGTTQELPAGYVAHSFTTMNTECGYGDDNRGYTYQACKNCGYENPDYAHVPHTGFTYVPASGREPTCQVAGLGDKKCTKCGVKYILKITIPASTQYCQAGGTRVAYEATCAEKGAYESYCKWCDRSLSFAGYISVVDHSYTVGPQKISEATCKHGLEYTYKCKWCSLTDVVTLSNPVDHEAAATYTETKAATCGSTGERTYYCKYGCGTVVKTETIPATGNHNMVDASYAATCTGNGWTGTKCSVCGYKEPGVNYGALGHLPTKKVVGKEATCTEAGYYNLDCAREGCNATGLSVNVEPIPAKGHQSKALDDHIAATCTKPGRTEGFICIRPGCAYYNQLIKGHDVIPETGHDMGPYYTEDSTCTKQGRIFEICNNGCGHTEVVGYADLKDHNYVSEVTKYPTCDSTGEVVYTCSACDAEYKEILPVREHVSHGCDNYRPATCIEPGRKEEFRCIYCFELVRGGEEIPALGHDVDTNYSSKTYYCTKASEEVHECTREGCDYSEIWYGVYYPGHVIQSKETKAATCLEKGVKTYYCANVEKGYVCDYKSKTEEIPLKDHDYGEFKYDGLNGHDKECSVCGDRVHDDCHVVYEDVCFGDKYCTECDYSGQLWHLDVEMIITEPATCIEFPIWYDYCRACGQEVKYEYDYENPPLEGWVDPENHDKRVIVTQEKQATCEEDGYVREYCTNCDVVINETKYDALGHTEQKYCYPGDVIDPTCCKDGKYNLYCSRCDEKVFTDLILPAKQNHTFDWRPVGEVKCEIPFVERLYCANTDTYLGVEHNGTTRQHDWTVWGQVKAPTSTEEGLESRSCQYSNCGVVDTRPIPATGNGDDPTPTPTPTPSADPNHTPTPTPSADPGDEPTPTSHPDDGPIGPFPTKNPYPIPTPVIDPDHEHEEQELKGFPPTCTEYGREDGTSCGICGETVTGGEWIAPTGHTPVVIPAVAPTETETGLTEGLKCGVCGEILRKQFIVDATGKYYDPENPDVPLDNPFAPGDIIDPSGEDVIGKVDPMGNVTDPSGKYVGTVDEEGNIIDENGNVIGKVDENGKVTDKVGNHVGDVFGYDELEGRLEPGHPNFNLSDYLDEYYSHVEGGDQIRPTIDEDKCIIGTKVKLDKDGITVLIKGAEDYAICPVDNYPMSQWIDLGNGMHKRICTCLDCDYYEIAACVYFIINVDDVEYKICPICGHFTERAYEWIKGVKVGGVGDMNELIARDIASPFGTDAVQVKDMSAEPTVITSSFTAVKSTKGVLDLWFATESLYIPMVHPGDVTMVQMNMDGEFTAVPFEYENGYVIFNADEHGLYLFVD